MYYLGSQFKIGDEVEFIIIDFYLNKKIKGIIIDKVERFKKEEFIAKGENNKLYQFSREYLSYSNNQQLNKSEGYFDVKEYLPPLNKKVIITDGRDYDIKYLTITEGFIVGTGNLLLDFSWYPGGRPLENSSHWSNIPKINTQ